MIVMRLPRLWHHHYRAFSSTGPRSHYDALGLTPSATARDIKNAYYELSKRYHPDANPSIGKEAAAAKFHQVAAAYEVLGSDDRRRAYDAQTVTTRPSPTSPWTRASAGDREKPLPTDEEIIEHFDSDYKHFIEFQRRRRQPEWMRRPWRMPPEYFREFEKYNQQGYNDGGPVNATTEDHRKSKVSEEQAQADSEVRRRFVREREKWGTPTFEQMLIREAEVRARKRQEISAISSVAALSIGLILVLIYTVPRDTSGARRIGGGGDGGMF